jgi:hypothetical protein
MLKTIVGIILVFTVVIVHAAAVDNWRNDTLCGHKLPNFQAATFEGYRQVFCSKLLDNSQLCIGEKENVFENDQADITNTLKVERVAVDGKRTLLIEIDKTPFSFEPNAFLLHSVDFTGDGKQQLLLGIMFSEGNGIGIQTWRVWAISDNHVSKPIMAQDYGTLSFATRAKQGSKCESKCFLEQQQCHLLVAQWLRGSEPVRGDGWYVAGHWYDLYESEFFLSSSPTIFHRFLNSFGEKRGENMLGEGHWHPLLWYKFSGTRALIGPNLFEYEDVFSDAWF